MYKSTSFRFYTLLTRDWFVIDVVEVLLARNNALSQSNFDLGSVFTSVSMFD